jgi:hypothetical protein
MHLGSLHDEHFFVNATLALTISLTIEIDETVKVERNGQNSPGISYTI